MSEKLCALRKKGGKGTEYTETSLWTNSSPTSSFTSQTVTLSQSIDNYKYVKIKFRLSTSNSTTSETIYSVDDFKAYTSTTALGISGGIIGQPVASQGYVRKVIYSSATQIQFDTAYRLAVNDANTSYLIPLEILGLNELDHGKRFDETTLWTNNAPTNSFDAQNVTLSSDMDNYDYLMVRFRNSTSNATESEVFISPANLKKSLASLGTNRVEVAIGSTGTYAAYRRVTYIDDTTINFTKALQISGTGSNTTMAIPTSIVGCKFA